MEVKTKKNYATQQIEREKTLVESYNIYNNISPSSKYAPTDLLKCSCHNESITENERDVLLNDPLVTQP